MKVFGKLLNIFVKGKKTEKKLPEKHTEINLDILIEFANYIKNRNEEEIKRISKFEYVDGLDFYNTIHKLMENNILKNATTYEKLLILKVVDLKKILKDFKLKSTGKKEELIQRITSNINELSIKKYVSKGNVIVLTDIGKIKIEEYEIKKEFLKKELKEKLLFAIENNDKKYCDSLKNSYKIFERSDIFKKDDSIPKIEINNLKKIMFNELKIIELKDIKNSENYQKKLRNVMVYLAIYGGLIGFSIDSIILRYLDEDIIAPRLEEIMLKIGYSQKGITNETMLNEYIKFYISKIMKKNTLKVFKEAQIKKVQILKINPNCYIHKEINSDETFEINDELEDLPIDYGCECEYIMVD